MQSDEKSGKKKWVTDYLSSRMGVFQIINLCEYFKLNPIFMNYVVSSKSEEIEEPQTAMQLCESLRQLSRVLQGEVWSTIDH